MTCQHKSLAVGPWQEFSLVTQMAHIDSELERAIACKQKGNGEWSGMAFERALELLDLTLEAQSSAPALREDARVRELLADSLMGENSYSSTDEAWRKYSYAFAVAARARLMALRGRWRPAVSYIGNSKFSPN